MAEFVLMFWKDKPVDWLLDHMVYTKVCNPEKDMHFCQMEKRKIKVHFKFTRIRIINLIIRKI